MKRGVLLILTGILVGAVGMSLAHQGKTGSSVRVLSTQETEEQLDGKATAATVVEVTLAPGGAGMPHRHPGPVFGYVLQGDYELGIDNKPTTILKAGETFYEPTMCLHRVSKNPSTESTTRLIAVVLHPKDAKRLTIPEKPSDLDSRPSGK
ncbi:Cupin domain protein [Planctomycetes bacterium Pan216]|uniref:Cupin domain protein n=1 Tax=Kolteria novifilia TaxID=2527975 RepID=A0A518B271_9BACT|nr:Cupin domain protein [Planctomycetes bacterium Pan216]